MKDKRIAELKAQVVALQPVKKHKIPIESNERFIQVVDISVLANKSPQQRVKKSRIQVVIAVESREEFQGSVRVTRTKKQVIKDPLTLENEFNEGDN